jgi:hypothetical protein
MDDADGKARAEEDRRIRQLRVLVDTALLVLRHRPLSRGEAQLLIDDVRIRALSLFPDKGDTFDLIYGARFRRLLDERYGSK